MARGKCCKQKDKTMANTRKCRNSTDCCVNAEKSTSTKPALDNIKQKTVTGLHLIGYTLLFSHLSFIPYAYAGPTGGTIVGGVGDIQQSGLTTTINQSSSSLAINWNTFNVNKNEIVNYIQPSSSSIALNRILGNNGSQIQGQINANGQIILVNPNGIFFTETSSINVGGLIASGLDIDPADFMNGNYVFNALDGTDGKIINSGIINAATGGSITLVGQQVANEGLISANLGAVNLAVGKQAVVTFDSAGLVGIRISKAIMQDELGIDPAVLNNGEITAQGGRILLTASQSQDLFSQAVNTGDITQATSAVVNEDGTFTLGSGADVVNNGILDVSQQGAGQNSGQVVMLGENVTSSGNILADAQLGNGGDIELHAADTTLLTGNSVTSARSENGGEGGIVKILGDKVGLFDKSIVDVSGANGGGQILSGGDNQGKNTRIRNASLTYVGDNVQLFSDALQNGDGGRIINWGNDYTWFYGDAYARGGSESGNGGFVEISGKGMSFDGWVDTSAVNGQGGALLFDPDNIEIIEDSSTAGYNNLSLSQDDQITASEGGAVTFKITTGILESLSNTDILLEANNDITLDNLVSVSSNDTLSLTIGSGHTITITADADNSGVGAFTMDSSDTISTQGGSIIISGASVTVGNIDTSYTSSDGGDVTITSTNGTLTVGTINTQGGSAAHHSDGNAGGNIVLESHAVNSSITDSTITINGLLDSSGGDGDSGSYAGGNAGTISIKAFDSNLNISSDILAIGGDCGGSSCGSATGPSSTSKTGGNGGQIDLTADSGQIELAGNAVATGGTDTGGTSAGSNADITIQASSVLIDGAVAQEINGNAISITGTSATSGVSLVQNLTVTAGSGADATISGDIDYNGIGTNGYLTVTAGDDITLTATDEIWDSSVDSSLDQLAVTLIGSGDTDKAGVTTGNITTLGGDVTIGGASVTAGTIDTQGNTGQTGGGVTLGFMDGGYIDVDTITTQGGTASGVGSAGRAGGDVNLMAVLYTDLPSLNSNTSPDQTAAGNISVSGYINTSGGSGDPNKSGGNAGSINLTSGTGDISVTGSVIADGGDCGSTTCGTTTSTVSNTTTVKPGAGGDAGTITLTANSGTIDVNGVVTAKGGAGTGDGSGGNGGNIGLYAMKTSTTGIGLSVAGQVSSSGGDCGSTSCGTKTTTTTTSTTFGTITTVTTTPGSAGDAGTITLTANSGTMSLDVLTAEGGAGTGSGLGGDAGIIDLTASSGDMRISGRVSAIAGLGSTSGYAGVINLDASNGQMSLAGDMLADEGQLGKAVTGGSSGDITLNAANLLIDGATAQTISGNKIAITSTNPLQLQQQLTVTAGSGADANITGDIDYNGIGANGSLTITAGDDITLSSTSKIWDSNIDVSDPDQLVVSLTGNGDTDAAGITTGDITSGGALVTIEGASVTAGNVTTKGLAGGAGGNVSITSTKDGITAGAIDTQGGVANTSGNGTNGGVITLSSTSSGITVNGGMNSSGSDGDSSADTDGGSAGSISLSANSGTIDVTGGVTAEGGSCSGACGTSGAGGSGGVMSLESLAATGGGLTVGGAVSSSGGAGGDTGNGGNAATITLSTASGNMSVAGNVIADGGTGGATSGAEGDAAIIGMEATSGSMTLGGNVSALGANNADVTLYANTVIFDNSSAHTIRGNSINITGNSALQLQQSLTVTAGTGASATLNGNIDYNNIGTGNLEVTAGNNVSLTGTISDSNTATTDQLSLTLTGDTDANSTGNVSVSDITTQGGAVSLDGVNVSAGAITTDSGTIDLTADDTVSLTGDLTAGTSGNTGGNITVSAQSLVIPSSFTVEAGDGASVSLTGDINYDGLGTGGLTITAGDNIAYSGKIYDSETLLTPDKKSVTLNADSDSDTTGKVTIVGSINTGASDYYAAGYDYDASAASITTGNTATATTISMNGYATLGTMDVTGNLIVTSGASTGITDISALNVTGTSTFTDSSGTGISLTGDNTLLGDIALDAGTGSVALKNNSSTNFASVTAGILDVTSQGDITQTGTVMTTGAASFRSQGSITLENPSNDIRELKNLSASGLISVKTFNAANDLTLSGNINANSSVNIYSAKGIVMDSGSLTRSSNSDITYTADDGRVQTAIMTATNGSINITAGNGSINDTGVSSDNITASGIKLDATSGIGVNNGLETTTSSLSAYNSSGDEIHISNVGDVYIPEISNGTGNISFTNEGDVHIGRIYTSTTSPAKVTLTVNSGNLTAYRDMPLEPITADNADIAAYSADVYAAGYFGTPDRPVIIYAEGSINLFSIISWDPVFVPDTNLGRITNTSLLNFSAYDTLTSLAGDQVVEVESLDDVDPAIFTNVHNYNMAEIAIRMPKDQLYEDELEKYGMK